MASHSILIIDDEANQRFILEQALRSLDTTWIICTAATAQEALELIDGQTPDLIITDYNMPVMDGIDFILRLRHQGIPSHIFLLTAYSLPENILAAQHLCIDHYLTKPVPLSVLRQLTMATLQK